MSTVRESCSRDANSSAYTGETRRSFSPQTSRVGAETRWMRRRRPLSGSGQMKCSTLAMRTAASNRACGSSAGGVSMSASGDLGSASTSSGSVSGGMPAMSGMGASSRHSPIGASRASLDTRRGLFAASSVATMPPNEWPTTAVRSSPSPSSSSS